MSPRRREITARLTAVNYGDAVTRLPWPGRTPTRRFLILLRRADDKISRGFVDRPVSHATKGDVVEAFPRADKGSVA